MAGVLEKALAVASAQPPTIIPPDDVGGLKLKSAASQPTPFRLLLNVAAVAPPPPHKAVGVDWT